MSSSKIEWTDATWNPVVGCEAVSPGCDHCYAARVASRNLTPAHAGLAVNGQWTGQVRCLPERLEEPLHWRKPRRVFVGSMTDLFHPDVPESFLGAVWSTMETASDLTFQVLTKRPQRMAKLLAQMWWFNGCARFDYDDANPDGTLHYPRGEPTPNVWLGTSIESDRYVWRADHLRATPAAVRFLSLEPLLGPLPSLDLTGIDWVIVGGESGPGARPMHPKWVRDIRDRCIDQGVAFFLKQWGEWRPQPIYSTDDRHHVVMLDGRDRGMPWPGWKLDQPDARVMERVGKNAAGRELDGRTWDEYPTAVPA